MLARAWLWRQDVVRVQKIRVPDTGHLSWIVVDGEHLPVTVLNEYLLYLHWLGRSVSSPERLPQLCALQNGCHVPRSASRGTSRDRKHHREADANGWVRQSEMNV